MTDRSLDSIVATRNHWVLQPDGSWRHPNGKWIFENPPRYTKSLDLMHEAERLTLTPTQRCDMTHYLVALLPMSCPLHFASARLHAIAYLKVLKLLQEPTDHACES